MAANRRTDPYALGRSLETADVLDFGKQAATRLSSDVVVRFLARCTFIGVYVDEVSFR